MTLKINPVLCRAGTMNNYAYIITDNNNTGKTAIIDASEADTIIEKCNELGITPDYIFTTHHHFDHVGGNQELKQRYHLQIIGPEAERNLIPELDIGLQGGDTFFLGESLIEIISAPGHTNGHILWYFPKEKVLFTGDVLFNLCIGGLFEGTPEEMWNSLQKIKELPDDVNFYPGHEYTAQCLPMAQRSNNNPQMQQYTQIVIDRLNAGKSVAPINLGLEKECNPYLKITSEDIFAQMF